jgi:hypothetical protein
MFKTFAAAGAEVVGAGAGAEVVGADEVQAPRVKDNIRIRTIGIKYFFTFSS